MRGRKRIVAGLAWCGLWGAFAGCTAPMPVSQLAGVELAIQAAERAGADDFAEASEYLDLARAHLQRAGHLSSRGAYEQALTMGERARVDAELATALAEREQARDRAAKARARLQGGGP